MKIALCASVMTEAIEMKQGTLVFDSAGWVDKPKKLIA